MRVLVIFALLITGFGVFPVDADAAAPLIKSVRLTGGCAAQGRSAAIEGEGFGKLQGKVNLSRGQDEHDLQVLFWSDTKVSATIVNALPENQTWDLAVAAAGGMSNEEKVRTCGDRRRRPVPSPQPTSGGSEPEALEEPAQAPEPILPAVDRRSVPDLAVKLSGPKQAVAGAPLGPTFRIEARNDGAATAPGTAGKGGAAGGYRIVLELLEDVGLQLSSASVPKDVLVNGAVPVTADLSPGDRRSYATQGVVPGGIKEGRYRLCARIDVENRVAESDEENNSSCLPLWVSARENAPPVAVQVPGGVERIGRADKALPAVLPEGATLLPRDEPAIQLLSADMTLKVNGEFGLVEPVIVPEGGPMRVEWEGITAANFGGPPTRIFPRVRYGSFPAGDCAGGPTTWTGDLVIDESHWYGPRFLPAGTTGDLALPPRIFWSGNYFYFKGCVRTEDASGTVAFHDTNQVTVAYGELSSVVGVVEVAPIENIPDLVIRSITMDRARTQLTVWFGADPSSRGFAPPPGDFRYAIGVGEPGRSVETYHINEGVANVGRLFIFGFGAVVVLPLDATLRARDSWGVWVSINNRGPSEPGAVEVGGPLGPPSDYRESNYRNNTMTRLFRRNADVPLPDMLQDLVKERGGNGWAILNLTYTLQSRNSTPLHLELQDTLSSPGEDPTRVVCTSAYGLPADQAWRGVNRAARFLCVRPASSEARGNFGFAELVHEGSASIRSMFPIALRWTPGEPTPLPLGNLAPGSYRFVSGEEGRGGDASLTVVNASAESRISSSTALFQIREPGTGSVLFYTLLEVPQLNPSGESVHVFSIPPEVPTEGKIARFVADYYGMVHETDERDNTVEWTVGRDGGTGRLLLRASRLSTGLSYENIRSGVCLGARGGTLPRQYSPAADTISLGIVQIFHDGIFCDEKEIWRMKGYVDFRLEGLPAGEIASAVMRFSGREVANENCQPSTVHARYAPLVPGRRDGGGVFRMNPPSDLVLGSGDASCPDANNLSLHAVSGGWAVDVSPYVECVVRHRATNTGLEFSLVSGVRGTVDSMACVKNLEDFTLEMTFE